MTTTTATTTTTTKKRRARRTKQGDPATAIGYVRVSTGDQTTAQQVDALRSHCEAQGITLAHVCADEGVSGAAPLDERPGLLCVLDQVTEHGAGVVLVAKRDRLARSTLEAGLIQRAIESRGASVSALDSTDDDSPEAVMMRGMLDLFAQFERLQIKARTTAALRAKKARGRAYSGRAPYGYRHDGAGTPMRPVADEQDAIRRMVALRDDGASWREVCDGLAVLGITQRNGKPWQPAAVQRIVQRDAAGSR